MPWSAAGSGLAGRSGAQGPDSSVIALNRLRNPRQAASSPLFIAPGKAIVDVLQRSNVNRAQQRGSLPDQGYPHRQFMSRFKSFAQFIALQIRFVANVTSVDKSMKPFQ